MATDIYKELSEISKGRYGLDIRDPIWVALKILSDETYDRVKSDSQGFPVNWDPESIDGELNTIAHNIYGKDVKQAIYDALYKLWHMNAKTRTLVTGLAPFPVTITEPTSEEDLAKIHTITPMEDPLSQLAGILQETGMFSSVSYDSSSTKRTLTLYVNGEEFITYEGTLIDETIGAEEYNYWWYQLTVTNSMYSTVTYPEPYNENQHVRYPLDVSILMPECVYVTDNHILILTARDTILITKTDKGNVMIALGMGDRIHENITDPYDKIRAFTKSSIIMEDTGIAMDWNERSQLVLSALLEEGLTEYAMGAYATVTKVIPSTMIGGYTTFGTSRLYVTRGFAIEDLRR